MTFWFYSCNFVIFIHDFYFRISRFKNLGPKFLTLPIFLKFSDTPVKETPNRTPSSDSNLFTNFLPASTETASNTTSTQVVNGSGSNSAFRTEEEESFFNQSMSSTPNKQKPLTKDSILALYGKVLI